MERPPRGKHARANRDARVCRPGASPSDSPADGRRCSALTRHLISALLRRLSRHATGPAKSNLIRGRRQRARHRRRSRRAEASGGGGASARHTVHTRACSATSARFPPRAARCRASQARSTSAPSVPPLFLRVNRRSSLWSVAQAAANLVFTAHADTPLDNLDIAHHTPPLDEQEERWGRGALQPLGESVMRILRRFIHDIGALVRGRTDG